MTRDPLGRLAAANPVPEPPDAPSPERLRTLIEAEPVPARPERARSTAAGGHDDRPPAQDLAALPRLGGRRLPVLTRRLRLPALAFLALLATATIALAASGVILTGSPVKPEELLNPAVGEGVPAPGGGEPIVAQAPDPDGGLPWGMRIVRTTRGEECLQIGRVQGGRLGELGIDGAFHDDGRFHPLPADALPRDVYHGVPFEATASATSSCHLLGEAVSGEHLGVAPSAAAKAPVSAMPRARLRDVYFGELGSAARKVVYRAGSVHRTQILTRPVGAYLIVTRMRPGQQPGVGGESVGTADQLGPAFPLSAIFYSFGGRPCERLASLPPGVHRAAPSDLCPEEHYRRARPARARPLHRPLHVRLLIGGGEVRGARVSFVAPYAVTGSREQYSVMVPSRPCGRPARARVLGGSGQTLARNVRAGATVTIAVGDPFANSCGQRTATIEVEYGGIGTGQTRIGRVVLVRPPGTRATPLPRPGRHPR